MAKCTTCVTFDDRLRWRITLQELWARHRRSITVVPAIITFVFEVLHILQAVCHVHGTGGKEAKGNGDLETLHKKKQDVPDDVPPHDALLESHHDGLVEQICKLASDVC